MTESGAQPHRRSVAAGERLALRGLLAAALLMASAAPTAAMSFAQYAAACAANGGRASIQNGVYVCSFPSGPTPAPPPPPPPDPQVLAMQRVLPRFRDLINRLSTPQGRVQMLGQDWRQVSIASPAELSVKLGWLYDGLYGNYVQDLAEAANYDAVYRSNLAAEQILSAKAAEFRQQTAERGALIDDLTQAQDRLKQEVELRIRAKTEISNAASNLETEIGGLQDATIGWIRAALPQDGLDASNWGRWLPKITADDYAPGEHMLQALPTPRFAVVEPSAPWTYAPAALASAPSPPPDPKPPMPENLDQRMSAVEAMADKASGQRDLQQQASDRSSTSRAQVQALQQQIADAQNPEIDGQNKIDLLRTENADLADNRGQLEVDVELQSRRFAADAALDWIWRTVHEEAVEQIKESVKEEIARKVIDAGGGPPAEDVSEEDVEGAIKGDKANMFGLTDHVLKIGKLTQVVNDVHALADDTGDYAETVGRYIAAATPEQLQGVLAQMDHGVDDDVVALQRDAAKAAGLREPYKTVWFKLLGAEAAAGEN